MKVSNMISTNGNTIDNLFLFTNKHKDTFQSYETTIAMHDYKNNVLTLDKNALNYSKTTSKYLFSFTNMNRKELEQGIKDGSIKVKNLNK